MICVCNKFTDAADAGSPGTGPQRSTGMIMRNSRGGALQSVFYPGFQVVRMRSKFENHWWSGGKHEGTDPHLEPDCTIY